MPENLNERARWVTAETWRNLWPAFKNICVLMVIVFFVYQIAKISGFKPSETFSKPMRGGDQVATETIVATQETVPAEIEIVTKSLPVVPHINIVEGKSIYNPIQLEMVYTSDFSAFPTMAYNEIACQDGGSDEISFGPQDQIYLLEAFKSSARLVLTSGNTAKIVCSPDADLELYYAIVPKTPVP